MHRPTPHSTPRAYGPHCGALHHHWSNPPAPFNPAFDPAAKALYALVTASMVRDNFYHRRTREECAAEWKRRYERHAGEGIMP